MQYKSLDISASYGGRNTENVIDDLYQNLVTCNDIRSLSLTLFQEGYEIDDSNPLSFNFRKGDHFFSLKNLILPSYV